MVVRLPSYSGATDFDCIGYISVLDLEVFKATKSYGLDPSAYISIYRMESRSEIDDFALRMPSDEYDFMVPNLSQHTTPKIVTQLRARKRHHHQALMRSRLWR